MAFVAPPMTHIDPILSECESILSHMGPQIHSIAA